MSGPSQAPRGGGIAKAVIVALLVAGVVLLYRFESRTEGVDPTAMLALGFVVLASYTFGQLVSRIGLPHITGYLIAGLLLGPSVASLLPAALRVEPFVDGLLSPSVQSQLAPLKTLAIALIALTAGAELKLDALRRGVGAILGVLGGQVVVLLATGIAFVFAIGGAIPAIAFPALGGLEVPTLLALGALVGTLAIATSPAATIAVINGLRARGPVTSTVLATVVLIDIVVVVLFSGFGTLSSQALGASGADENLALYLLGHVGGGVVLGAIAGGSMALYFRYVKQEEWLFLVGAVYTTTYVAGQLHVDVVLLFITAGFVTANFSREGDAVLATVERLSLPVYVVFFTLAGAHLELGDLARLAPFAVAFVALRAGGIYVGTRVGGALGGASEAMKRHGWLGFVAQAGVAITLADHLASERMGLGELGRQLSTLVIAGIALNELVGPVLLKLGLTRARETEATRAGEAVATGAVAAEAEARASVRPEPRAIEPWPVPDVARDAWGAPPRLASVELTRRARELAHDLGQVARDVADEPLARFHEGALAYVRELRREFLRLHRRVTVQATDPSTELDAAEAIRLEQAALAERWRAVILARGARVRATPGWDPEPIVGAVDELADELPERVDAPYEDETFVPRPDDTFPRALARTALRARRSVETLFGGSLPPRRVELRALARFHLWGRLPGRLEPVAALYAQAETHLATRTRSIFEGLALAYGELARALDANGAKVIDRAALEAVRSDVEAELMLAVQEVDRIRDDLAHRTSAALGACLRDLDADLAIVATPDLPMRRRAASRLYRRRDEALRTLVEGGAGAREDAAASYNRLALEMELFTLEARVENALEQHAAALGGDVRGRAHVQVGRVREAVADAEGRFEAALASERTGEALAAATKAICEPVVRVSAEAARLSSLLRDQLAADAPVAPVLDALVRAAAGLTDRYTIPAGPLVRGEHRLPPPGGVVEIPFREWVLARIDASVGPRLFAAAREIAQRVEPVSSALSELERRTAFNLELALNELAVHEGDVPPETRALVRDLIAGALERHRLLLEGHANDTAPLGELAHDAMRDAVLSSLEELRGALIAGEMGRVRARMVRDVRGQRLSRLVRDLRESIGRSIAITRAALADAIGEARLERARALVGLPALEPAEIGAASSFAAPGPRARIPRVYHRLFSAQALEAGDILTGRDEALGRAMALLEGEGAAPLRTVAIVGPDGVGKSAFVNAAIRAKRWSKVRELKLKAPATIDEVDALFEAGAEGQLVLVSGIQWLVSLCPGGMAPLRRFVARVIEDRGRNAFLVRADRLVWRQCRACAPLGDAFPEVVELGPLDEEALEAAVLARHTVSGYGLVFSHGIEPRSRLEEAALSLTSPLSRPRQAFFRALHASSGGLLRDALRLWLAAVDEVDEAGDFVHLGPVPPPAIGALRRLGDDDVLLLYQVARQGWMSPEVLASLFRTDATAARARLVALEHAAVLFRTGDVFRVAEHLRGSVERLLTERGFVQ
ncbi:MAG: cation:proton antiporter [Sandaracinaceae bacterium]|nr:cation:proton antiporter [Sandaracinaceae bacterium]